MDMLVDHHGDSHLHTVSVSNLPTYTACPTYRCHLPPSCLLRVPARMNILPDMAACAVIQHKRAPAVMV